jgi:hypothetical protein
MVLPMPEPTPLLDNLEELASRMSGIVEELNEYLRHAKALGMDPRAYLAVAELVNTLDSYNYADRMLVAIARGTPLPTPVQWTDKNMDIMRWLAKGVKVEEHDA